MPRRPLLVQDGAKFCILLDTFIRAQKLVEGVQARGSATGKKRRGEFFENLAFLRHNASIVDEIRPSRRLLEATSSEFRYPLDVDVELVPEQPRCGGVGAWIKRLIKKCAE